MRHIYIYKTYLILHIKYETHSKIIEVVVNFLQKLAKNSVRQSV